MSRDRWLRILVFVGDNDLAFVSPATTMLTIDAQAFSISFYTLYFKYGNLCCHLVNRSVMKEDALLMT